jgi:hypothetical protein
MMTCKLHVFFSTAQSWSHGRSQCMSISWYLDMVCSVLQCQQYYHVGSTKEKFYTSLWFDIQTVVINTWGMKYYVFTYPCNRRSKCISHCVHCPKRAYQKSLSIQHFIDQHLATFRSKCLAPNYCRWRTCLKSSLGYWIMWTYTRKQNNLLPTLKRWQKGRLFDDKIKVRN